MFAFRIADRRHPIFDGTGAMLHGARWNSPGKPVIYAAETYAGALLETLVHANLGSVPRTHAAIRIHIPDDLACDRLSPPDIPTWNTEDLTLTRAFGDRWVQECRTAILLVPSVVLQGREANVLLNPNHLDFPRIEATVPEPVLWDPRLFARNP